MDLKEIVGEEIRKRRIEKGWSRVRLSLKIGATSDGTTVKLWEQGESAPSAYFLCMLADALECSVDELLGRK